MLNGGKVVVQDETFLAAELEGVCYECSRDANLEAVCHEQLQCDLGCAVVRR